MSRRCAWSSWVSLLEAGPSWKQEAKGPRDLRKGVGEGWSVDSSSPTIGSGGLWEASASPQSFEALSPIWAKPSRTQRTGSFLFFKYLFIYVWIINQVLVMVCGICSCDMLDLVPWSGIEPWPPALESTESWPLDHQGIPLQVPS